MTKENLIIEILETFFKKFGIKYQRHDNIQLSLTRYFNFRFKYISPQQRQARISKELSDKIFRHPNRNGIFDIFHKNFNGYDLNPYQSKESFNADIHDLLFNDWGIRHLHLSSEKKQPSDFFNQRTGSLLFIRVEDDIVYFIDIKSHNDKNVWSDRNLIRIIQNNWPKVLADKEVPGGRIHPDLNDEQIGVLRRKGYEVGINVDDKAYMMLGYGHSTSGDNSVATGIAGEVLRWCWENDTLFKSNLAEFKLALKHHLYIEY